jgi:hypothetical protein
MDEIAGNAERIAGIITGIIALCAAISAALPDGKLGRVGKVINLVGLNIGKASNDPAKQTL